MKIQTPTITARHTAAFGMPVSALTLGWALPVVDACSATAVVRDRSSVKGATKGDMGLAIAYFPGTTAWRPPIC